MHVETKVGKQSPQLDREAWMPKSQKSIPKSEMRRDAEGLKLDVGDEPQDVAMVSAAWQAMAVLVMREAMLSVVLPSLTAPRYCAQERLVERVHCAHAVSNWTAAKPLLEKVLRRSHCGPSALASWNAVAQSLPAVAEADCPRCDGAQQRLWSRLLDEDYAQKDCDQPVSSRAESHQQTQKTTRFAQMRCEWHTRSAYATASLCCQSRVLMLFE